MKRVSSIAALVVMGLSITAAQAQTFSEEDLAATIAFDSGHPEEGYRDYARSLAKTLSMLNPTQVGKVLKGRGPLRKAEVQAAKQARQAAAAQAAAANQKPAAVQGN